MATILKREISQLFVSSILIKNSISLALDQIKLSLNNNAYTVSLIFYTFVEKQIDSFYFI